MAGPRTPVLERTSTVRVLGVLFIVLALLAGILTWGIFFKWFNRDIDVTVYAEDSGLMLNKNSDVKVRGMMAGFVRDIEYDPEHGTKISIAVDRDVAEDLPSNVTATILPKTLFGEKYVELNVPKEGDGEVLAAGDTIENAALPPEVEDLIDNIYPLLKAVRPQQLSFTLNALSRALDGRGDDLRRNIKVFNRYVGRLNTVNTELVGDLVKLGQMSEVYAGAMPDLGTLLNNFSETSGTIVEKQDQLAQVFETAVSFAGTAGEFLQVNGQPLIQLNATGRPLMSMLGTYAGEVPCLTKGISGLLPRLNDAFRDQMLHAQLTLSPRLADGYSSSEVPTTPSLSDNSSLLAPSCRSLPNTGYDASNPAPQAPLELLSKFGITNDHNGLYGEQVTGLNGPIRTLVGNGARSMVAPAGDE